MKHNPSDLTEITRLTLAYYQQHAQKFFADTRDHDVSRNIDALLRHIEAEPPYTLLDVGCGPGRDLKTLTGLGHRAIGLEGCANFASMARRHSGGEVWEQDFINPELPLAYFDGVYANAALFHAPSQALPGLLSSLHSGLKPGGVLFSSNPHGRDTEGWQHGRYSAYYTLETWRRYMSEAGFIELTHYYRPANRPRCLQPWLASVWRRP